MILFIKTKTLPLPNIENINLKMTVADSIEEYKRLDIENIFNYEEFHKILITSHSTRIEGSTLTYEECIELIQKGNTPGGKNILFSNQTLDHHQALNFIIKEADIGRNISKTFIQEIAAKVMRCTGELFTNINGTIDTSKGEFRKANVTAGSASFMHYSKVVPAVDNLVKELNDNFDSQKDSLSQLEFSFYAHYQLVDIHPFLDGNGRTSRLLMNFIQRKYQLPLSFVFAEDRFQYYDALNSVRKTESFREYYDFMFSQYQKYLQIEIDKQEKIGQEKEISFKFGRNK
ncbi:Fic family protein [Capnocytophaga cynodegmi]|uniref:Fic family protein n=1 Tax=Capnocytophaga cynodegmi TaxID=28189 RepID=UPI00385E90C0